MKAEYEKLTVLPEINSIGLVLTICISANVSVVNNKIDSLSLFYKTLIFKSNP